MLVDKCTQGAVNSISVNLAFKFWGRGEGFKPPTSPTRLLAPALFSASTPLGLPDSSHTVLISYRYITFSYVPMMKPSGRRKIRLNLSIDLIIWVIFLKFLILWRSMDMEGICNIRKDNNNANF